MFVSEADPIMMGAWTRVSYGTFLQVWETRRMRGSSQKALQEQLIAAFFTS